LATDTVQISENLRFVGAYFRSQTRSHGSGGCLNHQTIAFTPHVIGIESSLVLRLLAGVVIAFFAFLFVTVSARIVGLVGVTSNPTSGMIIVTLLGTSIFFFVIGIAGDAGKTAALTVGTVVGIAASIAGDISQDLKSGYILGATPRKQQTGELLGALGSAFFVCLSIWLLGETYGFGSAEIPAPQATLMKTVIEGVLACAGPRLGVDASGESAVVALEGRARLGVSGYDWVAQARGEDGEIAVAMLALGFEDDGEGWRLEGSGVYPRR